MTIETANGPVAVLAADVEPVQRRTSYPEPFASRMQLQLKRHVGNAFGLAHSGVNFTRIAPGGISALRHVHSHLDEFIFLLEDNPTRVPTPASYCWRPGGVQASRPARARTTSSTAPRARSSTSRSATGRQGMW